MDNYRTILLDEFERRRRRNARYSLRAFARDIGMSPSRLSECLNKVRGISPEMAESICKRMSFSPEETEQFVTFVELEHGRGKARKEQAKRKIASLPRLISEKDREKAKLLSDWFYPFLAEEMRWSPMSAVELAKRVGFSNHDVKAALRILVSQGFIAQVGQKFVLRSDLPEPEESFKNRALVLRHRQLNQISNAVLDRGLDLDSYFTDSIFSLTGSDFQTAKNIIRDAKNKLQQLSLRAKDQDRQVYCVTFRMFNFKSN